jgi:protoporphyrinogen/coproporphyrinogen III oxidase
LRIAVIGAGPAGLTAAYRLEQAGHVVTVFEANTHVGGRTYSEHFGPRHHLDTGAGWLTSAYARTLALLDETGERWRLNPMRASGPQELLVNGERYSGNAAPRTARGYSLIPSEDRDGIHEWLKSLQEYPGELRTSTEYDHEDAETHMLRVSEAAARYLFAPMFEGLFAPLRDQSAEFLRSWVASGRVEYWQVEGGMDAPFKTLAGHLDVRTGTPVASIRDDTVGVALETAAGTLIFDGAVVAIPAPRAAKIVAADLQPGWLSHVGYAGQCRLYMARPAKMGTPTIHRRPLPMTTIASVEMQPGSAGAWGSAPADLDWLLVCGNEADNETFLEMDDEALTRALWSAACDIAPEIFGPVDATVQHLVRWEHAVPTLAPGHFTQMASYERQPPLVFAGDYTEQACVEGAVRSGERAASAFGTA